jgi:hypothetical protein
MYLYKRNNRGRASNKLFKLGKWDFWCSRSRPLAHTWGWCWLGERLGSWFHDRKIRSQGAVPKNTLDRARKRGRSGSINIFHTPGEMCGNTLLILFVESKSSDPVYLTTWSEPSSTDCTVARHLRQCRKALWKVYYRLVSLWSRNSFKPTLGGPDIGQ